MNELENSLIRLAAKTHLLNEDIKSARYSTYKALRIGNPRLMPEFWAICYPDWKNLEKLYLMEEGVE